MMAAPTKQRPRTAVGKGGRHEWGKERGDAIERPMDTLCRCLAGCNVGEDNRRLKLPWSCRKPEMPGLISACRKHSYKVHLEIE